MVSFLKALVKLPVAVGGLIGLGIATWLTPTRLRAPLALLVIGLFTFVLVGAGRGLSVINRYLLVPSLMVMLFAAVAAGGFTILEHGRIRTAWTVLAGLAILFAVVWTALRVDLTKLTNQLALRGKAQHGLRAARGPGGARGQALRTGADAEPSPDPRRALDHEPARRPGRGAHRPRAGRPRPQRPRHPARAAGARSSTN